MTSKAMTRTQWSDLSPKKQATIGLVGLIQIVLLIAALADIRRRPADQINGNKKLWTLAAFINFAGPIAYFVFGRKRGE